MCPLRLIVGLGNPGPQFERTRHNVGAFWVRDLADRWGINLLSDAKFKGDIGRGIIAGQDVRLLLPGTFMNLSGDSVGAVVRFYKLAIEEVLVAYDEMAFEPGSVRLKQGGGDNGHHGLKSVRSGCGNNEDFHRLRIGVGHPGEKGRVTAYLTQVKMPQRDEALIVDALRIPDAVLTNMIKGDWQATMNALHAGGDPAVENKEE